MQRKIVAIGLCGRWTVIFLPMEWRIWRQCTLRLLIYLQGSVLHCLRISVPKNLRIFHFVWRQESTMLTMFVCNGTFTFLAGASLKTTAIFHIWSTKPYLERAGWANKMADVFDGVQVSLDKTEKKVLWLAFIFETYTKHVIKKLFFQAAMSWDYLSIGQGIFNLRSGSLLAVSEI